MESNELLSGSTFWLFPVAAWLLTYLVHSTILLAAALMVDKMKRSPWESFKEGFCKFALLGGFVTATLQLGLGIDPWSGRLALGDPAVHHHPVLAAPEASRPVRDAHEGTAHAVGPGNRSPLEAHVAPEGTGSLQIRVEAETAWSWLLVAACAASACLGSALLSRSWIRLHRLVHDRVGIMRGPLPPMLNRLCREGSYRRSIRLTASGRTAVPLAMGTLHPEICLPLRALSGLNREEQESMLAHELAHLVRRDPAWLACFRLVESLFFLQPLNRLVRSRWLECAEYRCDAWAAALVGRGLPLARCLSEVASWIVKSGDPCRGAAAHGMARNRSSLSRRISRLLDDSGKIRKVGKGPWFAAVAPFLLAAVVCAAPGFSGPRDSSGGGIPEAGAGSGNRLEAAGGDTRALVRDFLALERELLGLEREIRAVQELVRGTPLEEDLGDLLRFADERLRSLHDQRRNIEGLIHRHAAGSGFYREIRNQENRN